MSSVDLDYTKSLYFSFYHCFRENRPCTSYIIKSLQIWKRADSYVIFWVFQAKLKNLHEKVCFRVFKTSVQ